GYIDEMRFSDTALYQANFTPPGTLARPFLRVWPQELSFVVTAHKPDQLPQQTIEISSLGGKVEWSIHSDQPWVKVNREGREDRDGREAQAGGEGAAAKRVIVAVDASALSDGRHRAVLKITPRGIDQPPVDVTIHLSVVAPDGVIDVGARRQLFIDRRFIEQDQNVTLRVHPPQRVAIDFPAPRDGPLYPSGIIYLPEAQVWRMYYPALGRTSLRYVESTDGLRWTLPPGDNVVSIEPDGKPLGPGASVMRDDRDVPDRRYKAFQDIVTDDDNVRGIHAYVSADGVKFTHVGRVLPIPAESHITAMWDPRINKYVAYMRVMNIDGGQRMIQGCQFICRPDGSADAVSRQTGIKPGFENLRAIGRIETDDLLKPWPHNTDAPPTRYLTGRDIPMVLCADEQDGFVDFYNGAVSIYPYAQDVYLAFPSAFRHFHPSRQPQFHAFADANGPLEVQLATSRDGIGWDRHDRAAYLETGLTSEPDRWLNMAAPGFVRAGEWLYQYYWTSGRLHDSIELRPELKRQWSHPTSLFAVRQRLDGFVSASVDHRGGWLTTPPIRFAGSRLLVNHNCNATGTIFVELRDLNDVPIPGYRLSECQEITGNDTGWEVRWRDRGGDVSELAGRPIRIHLRMRNADVYAFQFV
ncbi:MAG TPA: hypothetical protein VNL70_01185, partial [Tepidisphaeraceae bacterium]|nr:hypothetical protein [Tepidisphaeraceae bacterium]